MINTIPIAPTIPTVPVAPITPTASVAPIDSIAPMRQDMKQGKKSSVTQPSVQPDVRPVAHPVAHPVLFTDQLPLANNHISVDCVVLGFDGEKLCVLLIRRMGQELSGEVFHLMKLPGSLIYVDENLDDAAARVLQELTGLKHVHLMQFKAFGSKDRTNDPKDMLWLESSMHSHVERIVTIAYIALVKIDRTLSTGLDDYQACWVPLDEVGDLAFDHNLIISEAREYMRRYVDTHPASLFDLLPRKFTASQLRTIYELVYGKEVDVRNFHKKIAMMDYVVPLEEREQGVAHRAARYYRFDRKVYNKTRR